jgi:hypothetical protein
MPITVAPDQVERPTVSGPAQSDFDLLAALRQPPPDADRHIVWDLAE